MSDHSPEPCGCRVTFSADGLRRNRIIYCPTHAAAPDLLAALEKEHRKRVGHLGDGYPPGCSVCAAIAKAKGEVTVDE